MQIRHKDGEVLLIGEDSDFLQLSEDEAEQLLADNSAALRRALNEAKLYNATAKQKRIAELEAELAKLRASQHPLPVQQPPKKEVRR